MNSSDRAIQRSSQLLLRWAIFKMHTPSGVFHSDLCASNVVNVSTSLLLLRRLVDMCPFPQGKGMIIQVEKVEN
jgi:hypothetical protein